MSAILLSTISDLLWTSTKVSYLTYYIISVVMLRVGLSYDESDYGRSLWFVDLDRSQKDILSGHLVTLDEPEPLHTKAPTDPPEMTLDMCSAAFETKFGGLAAQDVFTANRGSVYTCVVLCMLYIMYLHVLCVHVCV